MKIVSVIPIKMQNERLPGKNTKKLGDRPLIDYIERTLLEVQELSKIYVYCSDTRIKSYLVKGIEFLKRPNYLDLPSSNFSQIFEQFSLVVSADIYVYAHATAPFIKADTIRKCISKVKTGEFDSAFTAVGYQDYFWRGGGKMNRLILIRQMCQEVKNCHGYFGKLQGYMYLPDKYLSSIIAA